MMTPRRERFRESLSELYIPKYDLLCAALGNDWQPYCGFRSFSEQASLYRRGRKTPGRIVTNADGGDSPHNYGCASDWTLFIDNQPVWEHNRWEEYQNACKEVGLKWGGDFKIVDKVHNQLDINVPYAEIGGVYRAKGFLDALRKIKESLR